MGRHVARVSTPELNFGSTEITLPFMYARTCDGRGGEGRGGNGYEAKKRSTSSLAGTKAGPYLMMWAHGTRVQKDAVVIIQKRTKTYIIDLY
jgi:hypothetical protein